MGQKLMMDNDGSFLNNLPEVLSNCFWFLVTDESLFRGDTISVPIDVKKKNEDDFYLGIPDTSLNLSQVGR